MHKASVREEHGDVYVTQLVDGRIIPWRLLTIGEYIEYDDLTKSGEYPQAFIENEIFKKCVKSKFFIENIDDLAAGVVTTVVMSIRLYSGPRSIDELNLLLNVKRNLAQEILHQAVSIICQGFPAYKPEDVYAMDYPTMVLRLAQAEEKLIKVGLLTQPIIFLSAEDLKQQKQQVDKNKPSKTEDLLEKYYEQENPDIKKIPKKPTISPKLKEQTIIKTDDVREHQLAYTGHELEDRYLIEHDMVDDTAKFYKEYIDQMGKGDKITIKTTEERKTAALERARKNEAHTNRVDALRNQKEEKLQEELIELRKAKRRKAEERKAKAAKVSRRR